MKREGTKPMSLAERIGLGALSGHRHKHLHHSVSPASHGFTECSREMHNFCRQTSRVRRPAQPDPSVKAHVAGKGAMVAVRMACHPFHALFVYGVGRWRANIEPQPNRA